MTDDQTPKAKLLLEREVAEILRCSASTIKRLRHKGLLAYKPGRPVLISEDDVDAYIERIKVPAVVKQPEPSPLGREAADANALAETTELARQAWLKMRARTLARKAKGDKPKPPGVRRAQKDMMRA